MATIIKSGMSPDQSRAADDQVREDRSLLRSTQRDRPLATVDLERSEDPELHLRSGALIDGAPPVDTVGSLLHLPHATEYRVSLSRARGRRSTPCARAGDMTFAASDRGLDEILIRRPRNRRGPSMKVLLTEGRSG